MNHCTWRKFHSVVEILCQSGDKKVLLEKAMMEVHKIDEMDIPPKFRRQINTIKKNLLPSKTVEMTGRSNDASYPIQNLTEDEIDEIIHTICELESFLSSY